MNHIYPRAENDRWKRTNRYSFIALLLEFILASLFFPLSIQLTGKLFIPEMNVETTEAVLFFTFIIISWFVLSRIFSMARIPRTQRYRTMIFHYARATFIVFIGLVSIKVLFRLTSLPVLLIVNYSAGLFILSVIYRLSLHKILKAYRISGGSTQNVLLVADGFSDGIIEKLIAQKEWGFRIDTIFTNSKLIRSKYGSRFQLISEEEKIRQLLKERVIDEVIYCRRQVDIDLIKRISAICNELGIIFRLQSSVSPLDPVEFQLRPLNKNGELSIVDAPSNKWSVILKSMADIYFSIIVLILFSPILLLIALIIRLESKGPVLFVQERIGLRGRKFRLYKFRTMVVDAEQQKARIRAMNEADGPVFKMKLDPRVTRFGRFLRERGLDELPQLVNVIKGEMSLIGPRPPLREEIEQYEPWQLQRLSVKPGITCSWQIIPNRHDVSFEEWVDLDLKYIRNWSLFDDLKLFFKTIRTFFISGGY